MGQVIFITLLIFIPFYYKAYELRESKKETELAIGLMAKLLYDNDEELMWWKNLLRRYDSEARFNEESSDFMEGYGGSPEKLRRQMKIMRMTVEKIDNAERDGTNPTRGYPKISTSE